MTLSLDAPWLRFDLGEELNVLSWAPACGGFVRTSEIVWRYVHNDDLPPELNFDAWLAAELKHIGAERSVAFLTSRTLDKYTQSTAVSGPVSAHAVATVGLSNAERVGRREDYSDRDWGTINIAVRLNAGLSQIALIEAMSIAVEARTAAIMDRAFAMPSGHIATGTGTDCIAIAAPEGDERFAGLHTDIGEAVGRAVYDAVAEGAAAWHPR